MSQVRILPGAPHKRLVGELLADTLGIRAVFYGGILLLLAAALTGVVAAGRSVMVRCEA